MTAEERDRHHLLVVDDEPSIHEPLADYLRKNGFVVSVAERAGEARDVLARERIDLALVDVMMPGEDGLDLTRSIRADSVTPIILVTARDDDVDKILGLEIGADDYVTKPFNPRELLARIKTVLRRLHNDAPAEESRAKIAFSGFILDEDARTLHTEEGKEIILTGGEFALLQALATRPGRVLNRDQLLDETQGREAGVFDRSIDNQVSRLRKKIESDPKHPVIIKTVRGGGYVFAAKPARA